MTRAFVYSFAALLAAISITGCASIATHTPVPPDRTDMVRPLQIDSVRSWGDEAPVDIKNRARAAIADLKAMNGPGEPEEAPLDIAILSLSGGGENGAFAAGLLTGWTEAGTRPEFQAVTGVSTGALIAPFAFLGSDYDATLEAAYTQTAPDDIYDMAFIPNVLRGQSLARSDPLEGLINRYITPEVLAAIAIEHRKGRRLSILTTNLDAGRPVVWDMGVIAQRGDVDALELFRKVILASAAIPGLLPPVEIEVSDGENTYSELHGDGSIMANVFAYQPQVELGALLDEAGIDLDVTLYVIVNGKPRVGYEPPRMVWYDLTMRSVYLLLNSSTSAQLARIHAVAQRDSVAFRLANIPQDYSDEASELFDQEFMRGLFAYGRESGAAGYPWRDTPPDAGRP